MTYSANVYANRFKLVSTQFKSCCYSMSLDTFQILIYKNAFYKYDLNADATHVFKT